MDRVPENLNTHLHIENYREAFTQPVLDHQGLIFTRNRPRLSLDGEWLCVPDPHEEALRQRWFEAPDVPPRDWANPPDYSDGGAYAVTVPGCVGLYDQRWDLYEGAAWFTRYFDFTPRAGERVFLRVGAAALQALVFLNGRFLGIHYGGSTPFCVELENLVPGKNRLNILVDFSRRPEGVPMRHFDWHNYGGLYRSVELFCLPKVFIADFRAALVPGSGMKKAGFAIALSEAMDGEARVRIPELNLDLPVRVSGGKGRCEAVVDAELWSPERPRLYQATATFGCDTVTDRIGFREVRVEGEKILLNGMSIWLRGICAHEEYPGLGKTATPGGVRQMLTHARELGCNFMRLAHYPHHEDVAMLADEMGIMLWEEIPVYWAIAFDNPATLADAENQLRELIRRDANRASVILWGIGNENEDSDARFRFMATLADAARDEDPTRLVGAACLVNAKEFRIEDRLVDKLDVVGVNQYVGWYIPDFRHLDALLAASNPGKPVIVTETGAGAIPGLRGGKAERFTEDCQAEVYRQQIAKLHQTEYVRGMTPWLLYDFRSERRLNQFQKGYNRKGLIAADHRTKKMAFDVLAEYYHVRARRDSAQEEKA